MKRLLAYIVLAATVGLVAYSIWLNRAFLIIPTSNWVRKAPIGTPVKRSETPSLTPEKDANGDADDNLDQALIDLEALP